jgi:DNA-binding NtrC family response regulator
MSTDNNGSNKILIVDDDKPVLESVVNLLKSANYHCITASNAADGVELIKRERPSVILTDLKMDTDDAGIEVLEEAKKIDPDSVVLLYTAYGEVPSVVEAFKKGAFDFIQKIKTHHDILLPIERAFRFATMQKENAYLRSRLDLTDESQFYAAVGISPIMRDVFEKAKRIALTNATVLITGETGTGKEVLARGVHYHSPRRNESFVPVAVGALPENLLEGELFGHVKGAYTGATFDKQGLFEAADKGTIFLDEVSEVSFDLQHKLLRVLQERKIRRLGSLKEREIDVRFISATNQDPDELVKQKKMREDLYFRLNIIKINIPPLRERREDIPVLAYHFLKKFRNSGLIEVEKISSEALLLLQQYEWPGNVRELQGAIERMVALATKPEIKIDDLPEHMRPNSRRVIVDAATNLDFKSAKAKILEDFEKQYIEDLLEKHGGNITKVASTAKLNRKTIYRLMEARKIKLRRSRGDSST